MGIISSSASGATAKEILKIIEQGRAFADDADDILDSVEERVRQIIKSARLGYE